MKKKTRLIKIAKRNGVDLEIFKKNPIRYMRTVKEGKKLMKKYGIDSNS